MEYKKSAEKIFEELQGKPIDEEVIKGAEEKASNLGDVYDDFILMLSMVKDAFKGKFKVPKKQLLMIAAAIGYVFMPIDAVPDIVPVVGYLDDIAIVGIVIKSIGDILKEYAEFKKNSVENEIVEIEKEIKNDLL